MSHWLGCSVIADTKSEIISACTLLNVTHFMFQIIVDLNEICILHHVLNFFYSELFLRISIRFNMSFL